LKDDDMPEGREPLHPLFRLASLSAVLFIVTVLAMVATIFSDPQAPVARFLNERSGTLIGVEVVATLVLGFFAMAADRRRTRLRLEEQAFDRVAGAGPQGSPGEASSDMDCRFRVERTGASHSLQPRPPAVKGEMREGEAPAEPHSQRQP
jgi:hypothetical protein